VSQKILLGAGESLRLFLDHQSTSYTSLLPIQQEAVGSIISKSPHNLSTLARQTVHCCVRRDHHCFSSVPKVLLSARAGLRRFIDHGSTSNASTHHFLSNQQDALGLIFSKSPQNGSTLIWQVVRCDLRKDHHCF